MKKIHLHFAAISIAMAAFLSALFGVDTDTPPLSTDNESKVNRVSMRSMVQVLADPEKFSQQRIKLKGFVVCSADAKVLFLSRESATASIGKNGLWLDVSRLPAETYDQLMAIGIGGKFAVLSGTLRANALGPNDMYSGELVVDTVIAIQD